MDPKSERRGLIAAGLAGVALLAVGVVALMGLKRVDRREMCLWNLSRIGLVVIAAEPLDAEGWDRIGTGRAFFMEFTGWPGPPPFPIDPVWFCCPEVGTPERGRIDYRGPAAPLRSMGKDDPIAADRLGNHGPGSGGNVVLRNGAVKSVPETDPAWSRAAATTTGN
jgi:hypothetical protein